MYTKRLIVQLVSALHPVRTGISVLLPHEVIFCRFFFKASGLSSSSCQITRAQV
jgi:hypothetical protein